MIEAQAQRDMSRVWLLVADAASRFADSQQDTSGFPMLRKALELLQKPGNDNPASLDVSKIYSKPTLATRKDYIDFCNYYLIPAPIAEPTAKDTSRTSPGQFKIEKKDSSGAKAYETNADSVSQAQADSSKRADLGRSRAGSAKSQAKVRLEDGIASNVLYLRKLSENAFGAGRLQGMTTVMIDNALNEFQSLSEFFKGIKLHIRELPENERPHILGTHDVPYELLKTTEGRDWREKGIVTLEDYLGFCNLAMKKLAGRSEEISNEMRQDSIKKVRNAEQAHAESLRVAKELAAMPEKEEAERATTEAKTGEREEAGQDSVSAPSNKSPDISRKPGAKEAIAIIMDPDSGIVVPAGMTPKGYEMERSAAAAVFLSTFGMSDASPRITGLVEAAYLMLPPQAADSIMSTIFENAGNAPEDSIAQAIISGVLASSTNDFAHEWRSSMLRKVYAAIPK